MVVAPYVLSESLGICDRVLGVTLQRPLENATLLIFGHVVQENLTRRSGVQWRVHTRPVHAQGRGSRVALGEDNNGIPLEYGDGDRLLALFGESIAEREIGRAHV